MLDRKTMGIPTKSSGYMITTNVSVPGYNVLKKKEEVNNEPE